MSKKREILDIAKVHFAKKGYENTSLDDVAKDLGITKPALYYHFKNKKTIYNEIFKQEFSKLDLSKVNSLKEYIFTLADFFEKNSEIRKMFSKELACEAHHLEDETIKIISKTIKKLKEFINQENLFLIQTIIMSTLTNYHNTINLRKKVSNLTNINPNINDIKIELYEMIQNYIKGEK